MDQRPPDGAEPRPDPSEPPEAPPETPPAAPEQPRSTIISAEPVLTDQPSADAPAVTWAAPPPPSQGRAVPGAAGFVFADTPRRFVAWLLDNFLLGVASIVIVTVIAAVANLEGNFASTTYSAIFSVISAGLSLLYFVLFWSGGWRATPGMRALQLQVGTAFDGRPLEMGPALVRWALLGYPLGLLALIPSIGSLISGLGILWYIALLVSTIASDTKQGLHDRAARSAVVQPAGLGQSALVIGCLVLIVGVIALWLLAVFTLLSSGQMQEILEEVGRSI